MQSEDTRSGELDLQILKGLPDFDGAQLYLRLIIEVDLIRDACMILATRG